MNGRTIIEIMGVCLRFTILLALAYAMSGAGTVRAEERKMLWQSRDQFVALERQEQGGNSHPVEVAPETLTALLAAIDVRPEPGGKVEALFTPASLEALVPHLHEALRTASVRDDVVFAVIGLHTSLLGFAKSPKVTTGRLFRQDGRLNLIVGQVQQDVNEREDRRLAPFVPGSRQQVSEGVWQLLPRAGQEAFTLTRKDWIVFTDVPRPVTITVPAPPKPVPPPQLPTAPPSALPKETRTPVERMQILNELKSKGLISEEEFRNKRQQILDGI